MLPAHVCLNNVNAAARRESLSVSFAICAEGAIAGVSNSIVSNALKYWREQCCPCLTTTHVQKAASQPFPQRNFASQTRRRARHHNAQSACTPLVLRGSASMSALAASSALRRALAAPASGVALSSSRLALCRSASRSVTTSVHFKAAGLPVGQLGTQTKNTEEVRTCLAAADSCLCVPRCTAMLSRRHRCGCRLRVIALLLSMLRLAFAAPAPAWRTWVFSRTHHLGRLTSLRSHFTSRFCGALALRCACLTRVSAPAAPTPLCTCCQSPRFPTRCASLPSALAPVLPASALCRTTC